MVSSSRYSVATALEVPQEFVDNLQNREDLSSLTEQDATDIAALLEKARNDEHTLAMVEKMKNENAKQIMALKSEMPQNDVMVALKKTIEDIQALDILFRDPERAMRELDKEGMIDKKRMKDYTKNPKLLEEDLHKSFYFQFVTLAVAGGWL